MTKAEGNEQIRKCFLSAQDAFDGIQLNAGVIDQLLRVALNGSVELSDPAEAIIRAALRYVRDIQDLLGNTK
jgi:hypothetical protein